MIAGHKILSVITARANSQGIPGKNTKNLCNMPLVNWSVLASLASDYVDLTVISSNCPLVKDATANLQGKTVQWIHRPDRYATPTSKNEDALIHAYNIARAELKFEADIIINLQPTSPIRNNNLIDRCIGEYVYYHFQEDYKADSLVTVSNHTPFFWKTKDKKPFAMWDVKNRKMRQEYEAAEELLAHDDGNLYLMEAPILLERNCRIGERPALFYLDKLQALQIDEEIDCDLIENLLKLRDMRKPI